MITNSAGDVVSRRDYLPFGESLVTSRSGTQNYSVPDGLRQGFTGYERDDESQLNFAEARYYNDIQGRFTSIDPKMASGRSINPQSFNRYVYTGDNPTLRVDPNGEDWYITEVIKLSGMVSMVVQQYQWHQFAPANSRRMGMPYQMV